MPISHEPVGILTATMSTVPVDLMGLPTHVPWFAFLPSEFRGHLRFQKGFQYHGDGGKRSLLHLLLDSLNGLFAVFTLQFPLGKMYTHPTESSYPSRPLAGDTLPETVKCI